MSIDSQFVMKACEYYFKHDRPIDTGDYISQIKMEPIFLCAGGREFIREEVKEAQGCRVESPPPIFLSTLSQVANPLAVWHDPGLSWQSTDQAVDAFHAFWSVSQLQELTLRR